MEIQNKPPMTVNQINDAWKNKASIRNLKEVGADNSDISKHLGYYIDDTLIEKICEGEL